MMPLQTYPRARVYRLPNSTIWGNSNWVIDLYHAVDTKERLNYTFRNHDSAFLKALLIVDNRRRGVKPRKGRVPALAVRPTHCPDCGRPVRLNTDKAAEHPGTVCMFSSKTGLCRRCHQARQGTTTTQRRIRTLPADEPTTEPMTEAEVQQAMPAPKANFVPASWRWPETAKPAPLKPVPAPVLTDTVRVATAAYIPPAATALGPHYLKPDPDGEPLCACGWDPYLEADFCDDKSAAVTAVRIHLRKVRTVS